MKTQMKKQGTLRGLVVLAAVLLLGGCGESNNIAADDVGAVTTCESIPGASCVKGRFIDDAAVNVNYQCGIDGAGTVRSVTAADGGFSCPNGSEVTFSLDNPDSPALKIALGKVRVSKPAGISTSNLYFYVTPRDLAGDGNATSASPTAINLSRFLQSIGDDTLPADLPSHRVLISDATKRKITETVAEDIKFNLSPAADPAAPVDGTFEFAVKPFLQSLSPARTLVSITDGDELLLKGVYSTMAGVYESYDLSASGGSSTSGGMYGVGGGKYFIGSLWNLVDRRGRTIGSGVYSYRAGSDTLLWSDPFAIALKSTPNPADPTTTSIVWPLNDDLQDITYDLVDDSGTPTGQVARFTSGLMRRGAVAGNTHIYESLFAETPTASDLGHWSLATGSSTPVIPAGSLTMVHTAPAAPTMNPDLWDDARIDFPIAVTVTLKNRDFSCDILGCDMTSFRMVILRDGNIISDKNGRCGKEFIPADPSASPPTPDRHVDINPKTLQYESDHAKEVPIGVVQNILNGINDENGSPMEAMTMLVMIPNDPDFRAISPYLPYAQFGSGFGDDSLLRVDSSANRLHSYASCTAGKASANLCQRQGAFAPDLATWRNNLTSARALNSSAAQAVKDNVGGFIVSEPTAGCP